MVENDEKKCPCPFDEENKCSYCDAPRSECKCSEDDYDESLNYDVGYEKNEVINNGNKE